MTNKDFLLWIHGRLLHHGENQLYDYMHRLREIATAQEDPAIKEDTPAHDSVDGLCRRMLVYASMGAGGKTDQMRASDIKRALAVFFTDEEIERAVKEICGS